MCGDPTLDVFLEERRIAYSHDSIRYPRYFGKARSLPWATPNYQRKRGSTGPLSSHLTDWAQSGPDDTYTVVVPRTAARQPVMRALTNREAEGITFSLFEPYVQDLKGAVRIGANISRQISTGFTQGYLDELDGDIATGFPVLAHFDELSRDFPVYDLESLSYIARFCALDQIVNTVETDLNEWYSWLSARGSNAHRILSGKARWLLRALYAYACSQEPEQTIHVLRRRISGTLREVIRPYLATLRPTTGTPEERMYAAQLQLEQLAQKLSSYSYSIATELERTRGDIALTSADVVLMTVNEIEASAVRRALEGEGLVPQAHHGATNVYWIYGPVGGATVALLRSSMGSGGPGGSALTAIDAARELKAGALISTGIAFAMNDDQPIGQLLISDKLASYELSRIGTDDRGSQSIIRRGGEDHAAVRLVNRFRDSRLEDINVDYQIGTLLSGEKLLDNLAFRENLRASYPEAIGGEMEGSGILSAGAREGIEWIVAKAVCDYAHNKGEGKKQRQLLAAEVSAKAVLHVLRAGGLVRHSR